MSTMRTLGLLFLAGAWALVIAGILNPTWHMPWFGGPVSLAYGGVPLLLIAMALLVRSLRPPRRDG
jgi:hypothetical protein